MGAGKGPKGKGKVALCPQGQTGRNMGAPGVGQSEEGERGAGRPRSRTCSRCGATSPAANKCWRTTPTTTTTTTPTSTPSTPTPENSSPPDPHDPSTSELPPRAEGGAGADGRCLGGGGGAGCGAGAAGTGAAGGAGARGKEGPALGPGLGHGPGPPGG